MISAQTYPVQHLFLDVGSYRCRPAATNVAPAAGSRRRPLSGSAAGESNLLALRLPSQITPRSFDSKFRQTIHSYCASVCLERRGFSVIISGQEPNACHRAVPELVRGRRGDFIGYSRSVELNVRMRPPTVASLWRQGVALTALEKPLTCKKKIEPKLHVWVNGSTDTWAVHISTSLIATPGSRKLCAVLH